MGREKYFGKGEKKVPIMLRGKEETTHTQIGKPKFDASFFKAALKDKDYRGNKY